MNYWAGKEILITGGTGSLGKTLVRYLSENHQDIRGIRVYSRDELKQWNMQREMNHNLPISFILGDVRDERRMKEALRRVDIVIHAAALKQVPTAEDNPLEYIQTNIYGTENVMRACIDAKVKKALFTSTDKAVEPVNLYGATKMCAERLWQQAAIYTGGHGTIFSVVRYGNVVGSRGSIGEAIASLDSKTKIPVTDPDMTRFWISLMAITKFILDTIPTMKSGHTYIPKMVSSKLSTYLKSISKTSDPNNWNIIGIRPGEKHDECLINPEEMKKTDERIDHYTISDFLHVVSVADGRIRHRPKGHRLTSANNPMYMATLKGFIWDS